MIRPSFKKMQNIFVGPQENTKLPDSQRKPKTFNPILEMFKDRNGFIV